MAPLTNHADALAHARDVKKRLRNPANAVADRGIELRPTPIGKIIPIQPARSRSKVPQQHAQPAKAPSAAEPAPAVPAVSAERLASFERLTRRIRLLTRLLERLEQRRRPMERSLQPSVETIMRAACAHFGVTLIDMQSQRRSNDIVRPRQIAAYIAKQLTAQSLPQIGRRMGGRDHTTILAAIRRIEALRVSDPRIDEAVRAITDTVRGVARDA